MGLSEIIETETQKILSGSDVKEVFDRLARGIKAVEDSIHAACGKKFMLDPRYGYIHSCPTNLGTGMRASVHVTLPGKNLHCAISISSLEC